MLLLCSKFSNGCLSHSRSMSLKWRTRSPWFATLPLTPLPLHGSFHPFLANLTDLLDSTLESLCWMFSLPHIPCLIYPPSQSFCPNVALSLSTWQILCPWSHNLKLKLTHSQSPFFCSSYIFSPYLLLPFNKACNFLICHVYYLMSPARMWALKGRDLHLLCLLMYLRLLEECLAHNRCSINVCRMTKWMKC